MTPDAFQFLTDWTKCPHCLAQLHRSRCDACGFDLAGALGAELARLSTAAAQALAAGSPEAERFLTERAGLIARFAPTDWRGSTAEAGGPYGKPPTPAPPVPPPVSAPPGVAPVASHVPAPPAPRANGAGGAASQRASQWTPTTALAFAGSVLLCGAGIGFAFFLENLTALERVASLTGVAVLAGATAIRLRRSQINATGEAMGAVAAALVLLAWRIGTADFPLGPVGWSLTATALLLAVAGALHVLGRTLRVIVWRSTGLVAAPFAALLLAPAIEDVTGDGALGLALSWVTAALIAAGCRKLAVHTSERVVMEAITGLAAGVAFALALVAGTGAGPAAVHALIAVACLLAGPDHRRVWSVPAGVAFAAAGGCLAPVLLPFGPAEDLPGRSLAALTALVVTAVVAAVAASRKTRPEPPFLLIGSASVSAALGLPDLMPGVAHALTAVYLDGHGPSVAMVLAAWTPAASAALLAAAPRPRAMRTAAYWCAPQFAAAAAASTLTLPALPDWVSFTMLAVLGAALIAGSRFVSDRLAAHPRPQTAARMTLLIAGFPVLIALTSHTVGERPLIAAAGILVPALILLAGRSMPAPAWPWLTGAAQTYFLIDLGICVSWGLDSTLDRTAAVGVVAGLIALVLTLAPRPRTSTWAVSTGISAVALAAPAFGLMADRTWWGAAAALTLTIAAVAVTATRSRRLPAAVRAAGAATALVGSVLTMVPFLALITPGSASLWLLPLIGVVASGAAIAGATIRDRLPRSGPRLVGGTLILTAAALGVAAVLLAIIWPVTETATVLETAAILGTGGAAVATVRGGTRQAWWYMGGMTTIALWSALVWGEIGLAEAYTLPPAVAAVLAGGILTGKRREFLGLFGAGAGLAVLPPLILLGGHEANLARALELVAIGLVALVCATVFDHLRTGLALTAAGAAFGPLFAGLMIGQLRPVGSVFMADRTWPWFHELAPLQAYPSSLFTLAVAAGLIAAAGWAAAGWLIAAGTAPGSGWRRWWAMPALVAAALTPVTAVRFTWPVIGAMLAAMACYLALTLVAARFEATGRALLPPPWAIWLIAVAVGIAGWSPRQLRVECFALPLGLALFVAGLIVAGKVARYGAPAWTVTPGVAATLGPSTLAVGTDPLTWRAIMVLVLAMAFMLLAVRERWKPPVFVSAGSMILSLALVLARHGSVDILPWLLVLLAVGGSLLALALMFERRSRADAASVPSAGGPPPDAPANPAAVPPPASSN
jgi:hypothetical protein